MIAKNIVKLPMSLDIISTILKNKGGQVTFSTDPYSSELQVFEPQYWPFHNHLGVQPGDEIWFKEDYRIEPVCQTNDGYMVTVTYKDGEKLVYPSTVPVALTAKDQFISGQGAMPDEAIRCRTVIQDIQVVGSNWVFTVSLIQ